MKRYSAPVPRYTSYPTAPHFSAAVGPDTYAAWLAELPAAGAPVALHAHPVLRIAVLVLRLLHQGGAALRARSGLPLSAPCRDRAIGHRIPTDHQVTHIHWGGGSPNILSAADIAALADAQRREFRVEEGAEFAVEIDPRGLDEERIAAFARAGVTRVSVGVQDFDDKVQAAINRRQTFEETQRAVVAFRSYGIDAINIDLVYGLPHQTRDSVERTALKVLELQPNRVAVFGYAHLPSRLKHQALIDAGALPGVIERFAQANRLGRILIAAGYMRVGLDHYALPGDPLASKKVARNFQGYTTDHADALIGLGASAIGRLPQGYVQNHASTAEYARRISETGLATSRGIALTDGDRMRGFVIERLMCDFAFPERELRLRYGSQSEEILREAQALLEADQDRLIERDGETFRVTDRGRPFVRTIAACFDAYIDASTAHYAPGV